MARGKEKCQSSGRDGGTLFRLRACTKSRAQNTNERSAGEHNESRVKAPQSPKVRRPPGNLCGQRVGRYTTGVRLPTTTSIFHASRRANFGRPENRGMRYVTLEFFGAAGKIGEQTARRTRNNNIKI